MTPKPKLTKKERGFVKEYALTENGTQAALKNYDVKKKHTAAVIASENLTKPYIKEAIEIIQKTAADRIPDDLLEKVHLEGLEAQRVISANITYGEADEKTNDFIEVPDHAVRHKFLDSAYKLKGSYAPEKSQALNVNVEARLEDKSGLEALRVEYEEKLKTKLIDETK